MQALSDRSQNHSRRMRDVRASVQMDATRSAGDRRTGLARRIARLAASPLLLLAAASLVTALMPRAAGGQTSMAPVAIPYEHTIYAGNGAAYTATTVAGSTTTAVHGSVTGGENVPATSAPFVAPTGMATDRLGNLYITDTGGWVRKVDTSGNITTFAGGITAAKSPATTCATGTNVIGDGCPANEAYLSASRAIAVDPATGDIYISENSGSRIRKVSHSTYLISTVVGNAATSAGTSATVATANGYLATCTSGCSGTLGLVANVRGIAVDRHGNLYIADTTAGGKGLSAVRLANFSTGQLTTVVNTSFTQGKSGSTCTATSGGTAGAAIVGGPTDVTFDMQGNLYIADSTCNMIYKVAENPTTGMVDGNSIISIVVGGGSSALTFSYQLATSVSITPAVVRADTAGNLYFTESTGNHVWFYDASTGYVHPIFGGGTSGNCYGVAGSGAAPYNGCDGFDAVPASNAGSAGLAFDPWGNLYISDNKALYIHKLTLGFNAPFTPTTPAGNANGWLHFGANDSLAGIDATQAPDFTVTPQACTTNNQSGQDLTQDCPVIITNTGSSATPQYESFTATSAGGFTSTFNLTNQAYPVCQPATAQSQTVLVDGATAVTLSSTPGAGCQGIETLSGGAHKYSYAVTTQPSNGTLTGTAPNLIYTPNAGYTGTDSFQYTVIDNSTFAGNTVAYDGGASSIVLETPTPLTGSTATVTLVNNTPPVTTAQSVIVNFETATPITLNATATNNNPLTYSIVSGPANGTLSSVNGNTVTYTPAVGFSGSDSFTFQASSGTAHSNISTVSITVTSSALVAIDQNVTVPYQTAAPITLSATGAAPITYAVATAPRHGALTGTAPNLTYTPTAGYYGSDAFTFTVTNPGGTELGTINITVSQPPPAPVAQNQSVTVGFNASASITLVASGGSANTYAIASAPAHGTLTGTAPNVTYVPANNYVGTDSFTFTATNVGGSSTGTISITVLPAPPVAANQSVSVAFNTATPMTLSATGTGPVTYSIAMAPAHGSVVLNGAVATYTPTTAYVGTDSFTFTASNPGGVSNVATVALTVYPAPPVAANQTVPVAFNTATAITLTATGATPLTYSVLTQPAHGTLTGSGSSQTYTPAQSYAGTDSFTFVAVNAGGTSNVATVSLTVSGGFVWTVASGGSTSATVQAGKTATYSLMMSGFTGASGSVTFAVSGAPVSASVSPNPGTLNGTAAIPVTVTLPTTGATKAASGFGAPLSGSKWPVILLLNFLGLILLLPIASKRKLLKPLVCMLAALALAAGVTGCEQIPRTAFSTPTGAYNVTVTATAGGVSSSQTLTLTVTN